MNDKLSRINANAKIIGSAVEKAIEASAGQKLKFTLLIWDDELWADGISEAKQDPAHYGLRYVHISSLPSQLVPDCLRLAADKFESKNKQPPKSQ